MVTYKLEWNHEVEIRLYRDEVLLLFFAKKYHINIMKKMEGEK
jgi:hypothetical protein